MRKQADILDGFLVIDYQSGNKKALGLLVKRWHKKVCEQAYWYTRDKEVAKDIAQDCWQIVIRKISGLKDPNAFKPWVLAIVRNKALDWIKKHGKQVEHRDEYGISVPDDGDDESDEIKLIKIRKAIRELPENQRTVIRMFYNEGLSLIEIGQMLGIRVGTVKSRLFHARERLKKILITRNYENE